MKYVFNKETLKNELHFDRQEFNELSAELKGKIKNAYLWSGSRGCWVSRSKKPNLYRANEVAKELGFKDCEVVGSYLSFAEQIERKKERAETRAERYEEYANNAANRGASKQSVLDGFRGDNSFFTQPNVNTSGGRAFTKYREKLFERYNKGFEEYRKSDYFLERAQVATRTAAMSKLNDKGYLTRRIKECASDIKRYASYIVSLEEKLYSIENGKTLRNFDGEVVTAEKMKEKILAQVEYVEMLMDKQAFYENKLDALGGVTFSKENIKTGMIVKLNDRDCVEVVSVGRLNIKYKTRYMPFPLTASFAEITEIVKEVAV